MVAVERVRALYVRKVGAYLVLSGASKRMRRIAKDLAGGSWVVYRYRRVDALAAVHVVERVPLAVLVVLAILTILLPARVWTVALVGLGLAVGSSLGWAVWGARQATFRRQLLHSWVQVGDLLEEMFILQNDCPLPMLVVEVEDYSDLPGYSISSAQTVGGNQEHRWRHRSTSQRRGLFRLGPTVVRFADPMGIFQVTCEYPDTREVLVLPPILHDQMVSAPSEGGQGAAASRQRSLAESAAIGGVRDYVPGDPIRRIHWPLSVRHRTLLVKEFDREMSGDVWLALDLDGAVHAGEGEESTLEYSVIWTATWAWQLIRAGLGVGLYTYGPERIVTPPARGIGQLWSILRRLAPVEPQSRVPLSVLLREVKSLMVQGQSLVIVTPSLAADWPLELVRPGLRTLKKQVVLLDAPSFGDGASSPATDTAGLPDESVGVKMDSSVAGMRALLASLSVTVHLVRHRATLDARPAAPGSGDWEYVITPLGKAVVRSQPAKVHS